MDSDIGDNWRAPAPQSAILTSFSREGGAVLNRGHETSFATMLEATIRRARVLRDKRRLLLGAEHYSGPPWYVLLHLFESHVLQRRDTIGDVCDGTEVPATTVLRWLYRLEAGGLVVVRDDHLDNRRRYVELSSAGVEKMSEYFQETTPYQIAA